MWQLFDGNRSTGIRVVPDDKWPGMWRVQRGEQLSDMVNLARAKDAALASAHLGGRNVAKWRYRERPAGAP